MPRDNEGLKQRKRIFPLVDLTSITSRCTKACDYDGESGVFLTIQQQRGEVR